MKIDQSLEFLVSLLNKSNLILFTTLYNPLSPVDRLCVEVFVCFYEYFYFREQKEWYNFTNMFSNYGKWTFDVCVNVIIEE